MTAADTPSREEVERVADAIDLARYQHPEHPRERPRPFSEADRSDREYAVRLAKAALAAKPADDDVREAAEADRYFDMAGEFGNRIQRAVTLIDDYARHGSVDHSVAFELKKILDPECALSTKAQKP